VVEKIIAEARKRPELAGVNTTIRANGQQMLARSIATRPRCSRRVQDVYSTLQTMFGSLYVSQFPKDSAFTRWCCSRAEVPDDAGGHGPFLRQEPQGRDGAAVAVVRARYVVGPTWSPVSTTTRPSPSTAPRRPASAPAPRCGHPRGGRVDAASGYGFEWAGEAREEVGAGSTSAIAFAFGLLFVFLILAAQYESWSLPVGVMMAVPFAILGALVAIALRGIPNDLYFQIGLLTLIAWRRRTRS